MSTELRDELKEIMIDPTFNVSTLLALYSKRQDDLRIAHEKYGDEQTRHLKEVADIRELHAREIRAGDAANAKSSAEALALAIQTNNSTTITNANNIRSALDTTAATMSKDRNDLAQKIADDQRVRDDNYNKRITVLEQTSYVVQGKEKVTDPLLAGYMSDIKELLSKGSETKGKGIAVSWVVTIAVAALALGSFIMDAISKVVGG